ncbi:hypothetical protein [Actinosynnema sp. ALI-1.44]|uniref:hypothetical protein n=1 Tax=Actinosynnema sp. ALI-1.44 TaxID=1933779 RepID=UPI00143D0F24|nr:hypothetical protein [Actinosynnema sp. ALI-1.44]
MSRDHDQPGHLDEVVVAELPGGRVLGRDSRQQVVARVLGQLGDQAAEVLGQADESCARLETPGRLGRHRVPVPVPDARARPPGTSFFPASSYGGWVSV